MSYTIKLEQGKYLIINDNGSLTTLRNGEPWPAAEELKHVKLVLSLAQRIEELEETIRAVVDGTLDERGVRQLNGIAARSMANHMQLRSWEATLRKVLEQQ